MSLEPQQALEVATVNALLASGGPGGAPIPASQIKRLYDGKPPPSCGNVFYSVWWDGGRPDQGQKTRLEELFGVNVTITVRYVQPEDRWVIHRDDCERRANAVKALIGRDARDFSVTNAANALAGFRSSGDQVSTARPGWVESLKYAGYEPIQNAGLSWFEADVDANKDQPAGVIQRVRFTAAKRIQRIDLAVN